MRNGTQPASKTERARCLSWVKLRSLSAQLGSPLCSHERTSPVRAVRSEKCQKETSRVDRSLLVRRLYFSQHRSIDFVRFRLCTPDHVQSRHLRSSPTEGFRSLAGNGRAQKVRTAKFHGQGNRGKLSGAAPVVRSLDAKRKNRIPILTVSCNYPEPSDDRHHHSL